MDVLNQSVTCFSSEPCPWQGYRLTHNVQVYMMYQSTGTQHAKQRPSTITLTKCVQLTYQSKLELNTKDKHHFNLFLLEKKQLQNFGKIVNQQFV